MKKLGYRLFAFIYRIFCIFPLKANQIFCIMTHDASEGSNVGAVISKLKEIGDYEYVYMTKDDREMNSNQGKFMSAFHFFFVMPYKLARSSYVLLDNIFLPMAYMKFRTSVKVVQLWHGTGTIKKFGQSSDDGELLELEKRADATITHLVINSNATREIYKEAFGVMDEVVHEYGLPRTDILFDTKAMEEKRLLFYKQYPELKEKRLVLYAPTFRDSQVEHPVLGFDVQKVISELPSDVCLGLKIHPFVARNFEQDSTQVQPEKRVYDFSMYKDLNTLLAVADILITDYSSVAFDYCVLEKPMVFYAYDYKEFLEQSRGFYYDYETFVPGPVAYTENELIAILKQDQYDVNVVKRFKEEQYRYVDGQSAKRLIEDVFMNK